MAEMNRREARKQAFMLVFQYKFRPDEIEFLLADFLENNNVGNQLDYIENIVRGIVQKSDEIDSVIKKYAGSAGMDRVSNVSLAVLRIGVYEMLYMDDIPTAVSVNEAVGLAKEFDGEEAAPFVNGVLGKLKCEIK